MISRYGVFAQRARNPLAVQAELIAGFPHGLRTSVPPSMLAATELAECVNFQINRGRCCPATVGVRVRRRRY